MTTGLALLVGFALLWLILLAWIVLRRPNDYWANEPEEDMDRALKELGRRMRKGGKP